MEAYFAAKAALFTPERAASVRREHRRRTRAPARQPDGRSRSITVSPSGRREADWPAGDLAASPAGGPTFVALRAARRTRVRRELGLPGDFNVANAVLAAAMLAMRPECRADALADGFADASRPGRMERCRPMRDFTAIVDYAHTPDAIARGLAVGPRLDEGPGDRGVRLRRRPRPRRSVR